MGKTKETHSPSKSDDWKGLEHCLVSQEGKAATPAGWDGTTEHQSAEYYSQVWKSHGILPTELQTFFFSILYPLEWECLSCVCPIIVSWKQITCFLGFTGTQKERNTASGLSIPRVSSMPDLYDLLYEICDALLLS